MALNELDLKSNGKSKSIPTADECSPSIGQESLVIRISEQLTGPALALLHCCVEDFLARTSAESVSAWAFMESNQDSGLHICEPFAHFDYDTFLWRTSQTCLFAETCAEFSETWPRTGMMQNGKCYQQQPLVQYISAREFFSWVWIQTLRATDSVPSAQFGQNEYLDRMPCIQELAKQAGGKPNPEWCEWLMGFPPGWTELAD